jgi:hypothetical protein
MRRIATQPRSQRFDRRRVLLFLEQNIGEVRQLLVAAQGC